MKEAVVATDAFSYLDGSTDARALAWVNVQNGRTLAKLEGDPRFEPFQQAALASEQTLTSGDTTELLAQPRRTWLHRDWVYQLWADGGRPRGVWRRTTLKSFTDHKPKWQVLLDVDAFSASERQDWTFVQAFISPNGRRSLVQFSLGGSIRTAWREFDLERRSFVTDGFGLDVSSVGNALVWRSDDRVLVSADFGPGTISSVGSPLVLKEWRRGESLARAKEIYRAGTSDSGVGVSLLDPAYGGVEEYANGRRPVHFTHTDSNDETTWWRLDELSRPERLLAPLSRTSPFLYRDHYLIILAEDWRVGATLWKRGTVVAVPTTEITRPEPKIYHVFTPDRDTTVLFVGAKTDSGVLMFGSSLAAGRLWRTKLQQGAWITDQVPLPDHGVIMPEAADIHSDVAFIRYESFLHPPAMYLLDMAKNEPTLFASNPEMFDGSLFVTEQLEAKSADGVQVPYTIVRLRDLHFDSRNPTLVVGYGASGGIYLPSYSGTLGKLWLERGGVYVVANIRGGQERGPEWAVKKIERQHTYDDMIAVTEDLIRRKVTASKRVGFMGHSSGGLLGGVMLTQRPDLFGAVVLKAPLLDQFRLDQAVLGATAWAVEFGSTSVPRELAFLARTSPFQNLKPEAQLPKPFLITSTTDETVQPAQARRFAAKMDAMGKPFLFYETSDGGHGLAATLPQRARLDALIYTYLAQQLVDPLSEG